MNGRPLILGLSIVLTGTGPGRLYSADVPGATGNPPATADVDSAVQLETILENWQVRGRGMASGEYTFRIVRRNQSSSFGGLEGPHSESDATGISPDKLIRMSFNDHACRLDAIAIPAISLARRTAVAKSGATGAAAEHEQFQAALRNRFAGGPQAGDESIAAVPYHVFADGRREVHFWEGIINVYPRAVVLSPRGGRDVMGPDSLSDIPLFSGLVDAFQLGMRPLGLRLAADRRLDLERFRLRSDRPVVNGEPCCVIDERISDNWEGEVRRSWVDDARGSLVVRTFCLVQGKPDGPQYDLEYERNDYGEWFPASITVLRMSRFGDPLDEIVVVRNESDTKAQSKDTSAARYPDDSGPVAGPFSSEGASAFRSAQSRQPDQNEQVQNRVDPFDWEPGPGTWVDDYDDKMQYYVRRDGSRRTISFAENYAGLTYNDLVAEDWGTRSRFGVKRTQISSMLASTAFRAVTWPGILVTLCVGLALWTGCKKALRLRRGTTRR